MILDLAFSFALTLSLTTVVDIHAKLSGVFRRLGDLLSFFSSFQGLFDNIGSILVKSLLLSLDLSNVFLSHA
jgi:hypothetical protein